MLKVGPNTEGETCRRRIAGFSDQQKGIQAVNVRLLKLARRDKRGIRSWVVPGFGNAARLTPSRYTPKGWGPSFHWPDRDQRGEHVKGVDLDRHRPLARAAAHDMLWHANYDNTEVSTL
jgi:hypothetical protein